MENLVIVFRVEHSKSFDSFGFYDSESRLEDKYLSLISLHNSIDYPDYEEDSINCELNKNIRFACTSACGLFHWFGTHIEHIVKDFYLATYLVKHEDLNIGLSKIQCVFDINSALEKKVINNKD